MANHQGKQTRYINWQTAPELPSEVFEAWQKHAGAINPVAIVSTVDADGSPHAVPFGSLRAITPRLLRFCSFHGHETYANLRLDGRVTVVMISPPDVSVSVRGRARIFKERMEQDEKFAIVDIDIEEVKNDMAYRIVIDSGITIHAKDLDKPWFEATMAELQGLN